MDILDVIRWFGIFLVIIGFIGLILVRIKSKDISDTIVGIVIFGFIIGIVLFIVSTFIIHREESANACDILFEDAIDIDTLKLYLAECNLR